VQLAASLFRHFELQKNTKFCRFNTKNVPRQKRGTFNFKMLSKRAALFKESSESQITLMSLITIENL
jgi:hypothetical protein